MKSGKKIAKERINILFREAEKIFNENPALSKRYVFIARKIAMKSNIKLSSEQKRKVCKKCRAFLFPGKNCIVRTNSKTKSVEYLCKDCGNKNRYGYSKEKSSLRRRSLKE